MAKAQKPRKILWTPAGRLSFPYLVTPDTGRQYSDDKFKGDLLIPKSVFKDKGKALQTAVLEVGREYFGPKFDLKSGKWKTPFKDTDTDDKITNEAMTGCIQIRAKSSKRPSVIGPRKDKKNDAFPELTEDQIRNIKGGDWVVFNVTVYPYDQQGGGVTLGLNAVQFWKSDEGFGQGKSKLLETAAELEAEIDEATNDDVESAPDDSDDIV